MGGAQEEQGRTLQVCLSSSPNTHSTYVFIYPCVSQCGRCEGVQGVLTLFGRGKAQVCHDLRVEELREQLEVEEEDGDRQEEKVEEKEKSNQRDAPMIMTVGDYECAQDLSHECM